MLGPTLFAITLFKILIFIFWPRQSLVKIAKLSGNGKQSTINIHIPTISTLIPICVCVSIYILVNYLFLKNILLYLYLHPKGGQLKKGE